MELDQQGDRLDDAVMIAWIGVNVVCRRPVQHACDCSGLCNQVKVITGLNGPSGLKKRFFVSLLLSIAVIWSDVVARESSLFR